MGSVMPQSLANVLLHTVFSTKDRHPFLQDPDLQDDVWRYLAGVVQKLDCTPIQIGGMPDHVHLLTTFSRTLTIADFVKEVKRVSTIWIREQDPALSKFRWQAGYGVFSVSESAKAEVVEYIANQRTHHRVMGFQDEYLAFLRKQGLDYDERYVWD